VEEMDLDVLILLFVLLQLITFHRTSQKLLIIRSLKQLLPRFLIKDSFKSSNLGWVKGVWGEGGERRGRECG